MTNAVRAAGTPPIAITKKTLQALAPLPDTALRLLAVLDDPKVSLREIADIAVRDVGISASMLRMANSAMFGLRGRVGSISDALRIIGTAQARLLILASGVSQMANKELALYRLEKGAFMRHSEAVAVLTMSVAHEAGFNQIGIAYSAGLLHDIGKIIINEVVQQQYPGRAVTLDALMTARGGTLCEAEALLCGTDHTRIAQQLGEMWALPGELTAALTGHHDVDDATEPGALAWCVAVANLAAAQADPAYPAFNAPAPVDSSEVIDPDRLAQSARKAVADAAR